MTLDSSFCVSALERALNRAQPVIFNSAQGAQFTSLAFTKRCEPMGFSSAWMDVVASSITFLWNGYGAV